MTTHKIQAQKCEALTALQNDVVADVEGQLDQLDEGGLRKFLASAIGAAVGIPLLQGGRLGGEFYRVL